MSAPILEPLTKEGERDGGRLVSSSDSGVVGWLGVLVTIASDGTHYSPPPTGLVSGSRSAAAGLALLPLLLPTDNRYYYFRCDIN
jgi:hypothetical protein